MKFLLVERQNEGCDYTIGCGTRVTTFDAESVEAAMQHVDMKLMPDFHSKYESQEDREHSMWRASGEHVVQNAELYIVEAIIGIEDFLTSQVIARKVARDTTVASHEEARERAEYDRLQKKFGKVGV